MLLCRRAAYHDLSLDHRFAYLDDPHGSAEPVEVIAMLDPLALYHHMQDDPERFPLQRARLKVLDAIGQIGELEPPVVIWWEQQLDIVDGRHRLAWLARAGYHQAPCLTADHMAEDLLEHWGASRDDRGHAFQMQAFSRLPQWYREDLHG